MKVHRLSRVFPVTVVLLAMLVLMGPAPVQAQGTVVSIPDATVGPGEESPLPINITDITDVGAINIWLSYNSSTVTIPDGGIAAGDMGGSFLSSIDNTNGIAKMIWFDAYGQTGSFVFANVTFTAGTTTGSCTLDIQIQELVDTSYNSIPHTEDDGVFAVDATPTPTPTGGGGGGAPRPRGPELEVDMMGRVASGPITRNGELEETINVTSRDGVVTLRLPEGTVALDSEGDRLEKITVDRLSEWPGPPESACVIGSAYDFGPDDATFDGSIELTIGYDPEELPEGVNEEDLVIAYYHTDSEEWRLLEPSVVDTGAHTITASISHFTVFGVIGRTAPAFTLADLSISPTEVDRGESITISAQVTNTGGLEGSYIVTLLIDGVEEASQEVRLGPGASDTVTFAVMREDAGTYEATIDGLSGSFTVTADQFPWWAVGLGAGVLLLAVAAVAAYLMIWRRRRAAA